MESFDDFIYWGNIILQDFDTCDRYLVNIRHLYNNLGDFKELADDFSHLTQEMRESISSSKPCFTVSMSVILSSMMR